jgi:ParB-like chromosome segregation protein Spo0J
MKIEKVKIDSVHQDPNNKRLHNDAQYLALRESLHRFGQQIPIVVDSEGKILKGNGTWQICKELGWTHIHIHRSSLDGKEGELFAIADNRIAELSEWDYEQLAISLQNDSDMSDQLLKLGWTDQLLAPLRIATFKPDDIDKLERPKKDQFIEPSIFLDFNGKHMQTIAEAVAKYRDNHPSGEDEDDAYCVGKICDLYVKLPRELA